MPKNVTRHDEICPPLRHTQSTPSGTFLTLQFKKNGMNPKAHPVENLFKKSGNYFEAVQPVPQAIKVVAVAGASPGFAASVVSFFLEIAALS
jgi:hypothetical protein